MIPIMGVALSWVGPLRPCRGLGCSKLSKTNMLLQMLLKTIEDRERWQFWVPHFSGMQITYYRNLIFLDKFSLVEDMEDIYSCRIIRLNFRIVQWSNLKETGILGRKKLNTILKLLRMLTIPFFSGMLSKKRLNSCCNCFMDM